MLWRSIGTRDVEEDAVAVEIDAAGLRVARQQEHLGRHGPQSRDSALRAELHRARQRAFHHVDLMAQLGDSAAWPARPAGARPPTAPRSWAAAAGVTQPAP